MFILKCVKYSDSPEIGLEVIEALEGRSYRTSEGDAVSYLSVLDLHQYISRSRRVGSTVVP